MVATNKIWKELLMKQTITQNMNPRYRIRTHVFHQSKNTMKIPVWSFLISITLLLASNCGKRTIPIENGDSAEETVLKDEIRAIEEEIQTHETAMGEVPSAATIDGNLIKVRTEIEEATKRIEELKFEIKKFNQKIEDEKHSK